MEAGKGTQTFYSMRKALLKSSEKKRAGNSGGDLVEAVSTLLS